MYIRVRLLTDGDIENPTTFDSAWKVASFNRRHVSLPLTPAMISILIETFPELSWMKPDDWQSVAACYDWDAWIGERWAGSRYKLGEEHLALRDALTERRIRIKIRCDCRGYFGGANVPNVNDPSDEKWA